MNIQADKFLALTAMLAGFVPAAGCSIKIDGSASSSESNSNSDSNSNSGATDTTGATGGTTQDDPTGTTGTASGTGTSGATDEPTTDVPTTTAGTVGTATTTTEGTSTGDVDHDCREPKDTPGCSDMAIQDCVCAEDPICCGADAGSWDSICVGLVNALGCGMCEIVDTTGEGGSSTSGDTTTE